LLIIRICPFKMCFFPDLSKLQPPTLMYLDSPRSSLFFLKYVSLAALVFMLSSTSYAQDADGDGMDSSWETQYGLNPNEPSDALKDGDDDGVPNLWEFKRSTNPLDGLSLPGGNAVVDGSQATNATLKRYATLQEAFNAVPAVISGTSTPYYAIIVVKPGVYAAGFTASASAKKILWIADTAKGLVNIKPTGTAVLLSDTTVMDGFVISGSATNTGVGVSVVPHSSLGGVPPRIRLNNTVVTSRNSTSTNVAAIMNNGGDLSLVHCTIVDNKATKAHAIANFNGTVRMVNTIVGTQAGATTIPTIWKSTTGTITTEATIIKGMAGAWASTDVDPGLSQLWHLVAGDPAISPVKQKGTLTAGVMGDIYGLPRLENNVAPDLGAEQWVDNLLIPPTLDITGVTATQVTLAWDDHDWEFGYRIESSTDNVNYTSVATVGPDITTYVHTGRTQNTNYFYRVITTHPQQESIPSNVVLATTPYTAPSVPTSVSVANATASGFKVSWIAGGTNQAYFIIQVSTNGGVTWTDAGSAPNGQNTTVLNYLAEKTTYRVRVAAYNPTSTAYSTTVVNATTLAAVPASVSDLAITSASATTVNLRWTDTAQNETGYKVERSASGGAWTVLTTLAANSTTYSSTGLTSTASYQYRVTTINSTVSSIASNIVGVPAMPKVPTNVVATGLNWSTMKVTWALTADVNRENVRLRTFKTGVSTPRQVLDLEASATLFNDTGLTASTGYSYQVSAVNIRGEAFATTITSTTPNNLPIAPVVTLTVLGPRSVKVNWTDVSSVEYGFSIERSKGVATGPWTNLADLPSGTVTYTDDNGLQGASVYYYRVKASNEFGYTYSNAVSATTSAYPAVNKVPEAISIAPLNVVNYSSTTGYPGDLFWENDVTCAKLNSNTWVVPATDGTGANILGVYNTSTNTFLAAIKPTDTWDASQEFGSKVVVSGNRIFVAAPAALKTAGTASSGRCGAVYVFDWNGSTVITQVARLSPTDGVVGDRFGESLAVDGDRLIIGAPSKDVTISSTTYTDGGRVYLYDRATTGAWNLNRSEVSTIPENNLQFGSSVAVRGQYFVIGAPNQDNFVNVTKDGITLMDNFPDVGSAYFGKWSETIGELNIFDNPIAQEIANLDIFSVYGISGAHFGTAVTLDSSLTLLITAPDHSWSSSNTLMSPYYGGSVFKLAWNGDLGAGWVGKWWRLGFPPTRFDEKIGKTAKWDEVDNMSYLTSGSGAQLLSYLIRSEIGNDIGTKCAELIGHDFDNDYLSYSVIPGIAPTLSPWGPIPQSAGADKFQLLPGTNGEYYIASKIGAGLSAGTVYSVGIRATDDRGGIKDVSTLIKIGGVSSFTDNDNDGMDDNWEISYGLNPNDPADALISKNGDGLTAKEKYLRYISGMAYGINPTKWDLNPDGDEDGDGVINKMDAAPFDPSIKGLNMQILQPGPGANF